MKRSVYILLALTGLLIVFVLQRFSYAYGWNAMMPDTFVIYNDNTAFVFNRTIRLILNDTLCIVIIWNLFRRKDILKTAYTVFFVELFVILPVYFWVKLSLEGPSEISSPLLSQIHRMIVNPLLMFLLIIGFIYQSRVSNTK